MDVLFTDVGPGGQDAGQELVLWGVGTSRTIRAHWALHELGLRYGRRPILPRNGETQTPEYTRLNPRQKIPLLQDGSFVIGESAAIVSYLTHTYGKASSTLVPSERSEYARCLEWCFFAVTELDSTSLYVMRRHRDLKHLYGEAPSAVTQASEYFTKQVRHVLVALSDGRPYLLGDKFTTADLLLATCLVWAVDYGVGIPSELEPYLARITDRPAYRASMIANTPLTTERI